MPYATQGSSRPSGVCLYVRLLTTLSKLDFLDLYLGIKGPQLRFSRFIKKILS